MYSMWKACDSVYPGNVHSWPQQRISLEWANRITPKGKLQKLSAIAQGRHANGDSFQRRELWERIRWLRTFKIKCRCLFSHLLYMRAKHDIYKKCLSLGPREIFLKIVQKVSPSLTHLNPFFFLSSNSQQDWFADKSVMIWGSVASLLLPWGLQRHRVMEAVLSKIGPWG